MARHYPGAFEVTVSEGDVPEWSEEDGAGLIDRHVQCSEHEFTLKTRT